MVGLLLCLSWLLHCVGGVHRGLGAVVAGHACMPRSTVSMCSTCQVGVATVSQRLAVPRGTTAGSTTNVPVALPHGPEACLMTIPNAMPAGIQAGKLPQVSSASCLRCQPFTATPTERLTTQAWVEQKSQKSQNQESNEGVMDLIVTAKQRRNRGAAIAHTK